ncbi:Transmembrane domain-containing protein [Spironucleus salmonicida]|nr:Transmembrane domain-containing protein [Spironucleus salmonicida]
MLVSGAGSTLTAKGMSQFKISPSAGASAIVFNHPHIQTLFMFIGEFCCIFVYLITETVRKQRGKEGPKLIEGKTFYKFMPHVFLFLIPTVCDLASSTFFNMAIYFSTASVYQILRNVTVIFVALLSFMWRDFRAKFDLPQAMGLLIIFIGASTIALASILFGGNDASAVNPLLGVVFTLLGCFFGSLWFVTEEISLRKIQTVGLIGVANEGGWGCILYAILLPIYNLFADPFNKDDPNAKFEDVPVWAYQMGQSYAEILLHIAYSMFVLVFNFTGMEITNHVSSATRTTFDACRSIIVWIVSFIVGWEKWHTGSTLTRILGFILVTLGVLIYNNILRLIPFLKQSNIEIFGKWIGKGGKVNSTEVIVEEGMRETEDQQAPIKSGSIVQE